MTERVLLTVGSVLRGDDAAGPYLALLMERRASPGWVVVDGGQTPEDELGYIERIAPRVAVVVDAADMGLEAGSVRRLSARDVCTDYLITTHALPLSYLIERLEGMAERVVFIGVQPASTLFFDPLTTAVRTAVENLCDRLCNSASFDDIPWIGEEGSREGRSAPAPLSPKES